jgi:hypothetical protein
MEWGPTPHGGRVWTGTNVIDGLVEVIKEHVDGTWRSRQSPLAIGCCPWLTDDAVADALSSLSSCLVIAKPERSRRRTIQRLMDEGSPVHKQWLEELNTVALPSPDGEKRGPLWTEPEYMPDEAWALHDVELGPVRVAGWNPKAVHMPPLLHAKVVVLAYAGEFTDPETGRDWLGTIPSSVWWGSANLTWASREHIEFATWSTDAMLVHTAWHFVTQVIALSEPYTELTMTRPTPQLVDTADYPEPDWDYLDE